MDPIITPAPSALEAAAIIAAIGRFVAETAPPPPRRAAEDGWLRAARLEAVGGDPDAPAEWAAW
jgi:hypothetical protein